MLSPDKAYADQLKDFVFVESGCSYSKGNLTTLKTSEGKLHFYLHTTALHAGYGDYWISAEVKCRASLGTYIFNPKSHLELGRNIVKCMLLLDDSLGTGITIERRQDD